MAADHDADYWMLTGEVYDKAAGGATRELAAFMLNNVPVVSTIPRDATMLDSACGTGLVTMEMLAKFGDSAVIHAIDKAPNMVAVAKARFANRDNVHCAVMPGEQLDFPDGTFDLCVTNIALPYFTDPAKGATEMRRVLNPGGVALVTFWVTATSLVCVEEAQKVVRPNETPTKLPISEAWFDPAHLQRTMKEAGFADVSMFNTRVHMVASSAEELGDMLFEMAKLGLPSYTDDEKEKLRVALRESAGNRCVHIEGDSLGQVGLPMDTTIAVCKR